MSTAPPATSPSCGQQPQRRTALWHAAFADGFARCRQLLIAVHGCGEIKTMSMVQIR